MSLFNNAITGAAGQQGYTISRSVRLRSSASAYFSRTLTTPTNNKIWTWSAWVKKGTLTSDMYLVAANGTTAYEFIKLSNSSSDNFEYAYWNGSAYAYQIRSTLVLRDPSAWYHIVMQVDTTQATAANRVRMFVNNVEITSFSISSYPSQNTNTQINSAIATRIGGGFASAYFDGYLTEINFIDGQALTPTSFGSTNAITGVWQPAKYTGTYGTNGFYLNFSDNSNNTATTIGKDYSGNGNNWTPNNISVTAGATYDSMLDVPTPYADGGNGRGNYCVMNPIYTGLATLTNGNLYAQSAAAAYRSGIGTIQFPTSGKWYFEATIVSNNSTGNNQAAGISSTTNTVYIFYLDCFATSTTSVRKFVDGTASGAYGPISNGGVIGVAVDADNGKAYLAVNNTWIDSSSPTGGTGGYSMTSGQQYAPFFNGFNSGQTAFNFGQSAFTYTPPSGYVALNTYNLPASTITNGAGYMAATLYTGNGTSQSINNSVNGVSFQPDFVWYKDRSVARDHALFDVTRGALDLLSSNTTGAASSVAGTLTSFNSNGYSIGSTANANANGETYVGWQWKAGGTGSSNTSGSITSTVSVGATQGFSVVTYTATAATGTIGHGLGVAPSMIITARRSSGGAYWGVYHQSLGASQILYMQVTNAATADLTTWNATSPTSSVFSVGNSAQSNNPASATYVAYCFAAVKGFSAFGSYTGNGSTDGPFVYCGFRPRFILVKSSSGAFDWHITDTSRSTYNQADTVLFPNSSAAESNGGGYYYDILSNGFKCRNLGSATNGSGATYIFAAFAESPFKTSLAR